MSTIAERSEIAVLQVQMKAVQADMTEMKGDMKEIKTLLLANASSVVSQDQLTRVLDAVDAKIKSARNFNWITHGLTAILTAFLIAIAYWVVGGIHK